MWAAKLVLESRPRWLRHFYLYDHDEKQIALLKELRKSQPPQDKSKGEPKRSISVKLGDCNALIRKLLKSNTIGQNEATFCLLDQRNIECRWSTVTALSTYKTNGNKIEILYFLPSAWLNRALKNRRDKTGIKKWWGRGDWRQIANMPSGNRVQLFTARFKKELGYWSAVPWPIFANNSRNKIMYYMIHATDHPDAPSLMERAYRKALTPESPEEFQLDIENYLKTPVHSSPKPRPLSVR